MMIPSLETYKRMVGAHAGLWPELVNDGDDIEFAVKLGTDLAKAILKGAPVTLVTAVVAVSRHSVRIVGLRIEDDTADPAFLQHPQEQPREQELFVKLLAKKSASAVENLAQPPGVPVGAVGWIWSLYGTPAGLTALRAYF